MRLLIFLILLALTAISCVRISNDEKDENHVLLKEHKTDSLGIPNNSNAIYFSQPTVIDSQSVLLRYINKRMRDSNIIASSSALLFQFREPVLSNYSGDKDIYRFMLVPTFYSPICIRIERNKQEVRLVTKALTGMGGYEVGKLALDTTTYLSTKKWDIFTSMLDSSGFPRMPNLNYMFGLDGARFTLEAVANQKYHWIYRWPFDDDIKSSVAQACQYLIDNSPAANKKGHIYD